LSHLSPLSRIARAALLVMLLFVASRALGILREGVIAYRFGAGAEMDAYLAAFRLPDFLFYVVAGGALGSAFIPTFTGYLAREDVAGAWRLASAVINWALLILAGLGGIAAIFAPWLVARFYGDFTPAQQALTAELMRWMLISTVIFGVSGVVMGILNAHQHFFLPALAPVIYNLAIIGGAWFLGPIWGVRGLAAGVVVGATGHLLIQLPGLLRQGMRYQPILPLDAGVREVARLMAPRTLGLAVVQLNFVVTTILAAGLPAGSITALNYGWIMMLLPQGVIAQSVATALFPTLAALAAQEDWPELRRVFGATLRSLLFLTLPAAAGLFILRQPIARLLERGEFGPAATAATAYALGFFAVGLVGHSVIEIVTRAFYALKDTKTPVAIGVVAMLLNILLSVILMRLFVGLGWPAHGGLALANSIAATLEMVALLLWLRPKMGGLSASGLAAPVVKSSSMTAGMVLAVLLVGRLWPAGGSAWLEVMAGIAVGGGVYLALAYAVGLEEVRIIRRRFRV
jgi:putative peptidoglycan lipid II flippase